VTAHPANRTRAEKYATDHQKQHRLLSPGKRYRQEIAAYYVGEVDADTGDEHYASRYSQRSHERIGGALKALAYPI
jgi:hypothetical protein